MSALHLFEICFFIVLAIVYWRLSKAIKKTTIIRFNDRVEIYYKDGNCYTYNVKD